MNRQLLQAAWNGDVDYLLKEVDTNPSILHPAALEGGENPLHIACLAGHLNFAATVVKLRQQSSWELNKDGFSPLHIAASCGHVEIVKKLLEVDLGLCLIQGKDRKIPLHLAVVRGNLEVVRELLSSSLESIECTTAQGETSLHLAVKNNQFKSFQVLTQHLKHVNKEDLLNSKDLHGNTTLHLAVSRKQYEVVDFLLNGQVTSKEKMELNSLNESGLTPLDMLLTCPSEAGDYEIGELLIQAGALKANNLVFPASTQEGQNINTESNTRHEQPAGSPANDDALNYFRNINLNKLSPSIVRNTFLVIVVLITATTYQAALTPPGGTWQDDFVPYIGNNSSSSATNNTTATEPHIAGHAIMLTNHPIFFTCFLSFNTMGFFISLFMIQVLTTKFPLQKELQILLMAIFLTYTTTITAIAPKLLPTYVPSYLPFVVMFFKNCCSRPRRNVAAYTGQGMV